MIAHTFNIHRAIIIQVSNNFKLVDDLELILYTCSVHVHAVYMYMHTKADMILQ